MDGAVRVIFFGAVVSIGPLSTRRSNVVPSIAVDYGVPSGHQIVAKIQITVTAAITAMDEPSVPIVGRR